MRPPVPSNEEKRIEALRRYRILDTERERVFDDIALIASTVCATPIALMSLVDSDRQWFKARLGMDMPETPREHAFCSYTILGDDTMVVENATTDERFANSPLVTSAPHIRFYAGSPLIDGDGNALGSLCVIDRQPRQLTAPQTAALAALARTIVALLESRRVSDELAESLADLKTLRGLLPICAHCKGIRNDEGYWQKVEEYVRSHSEAEFTHGICPTCLSTHYPATFEKLYGKAQPPDGEAGAN